MNYNKYYELLNESKDIRDNIREVSKVVENIEKNLDHVKAIIEDLKENLKIRVETANEFIIDNDGDGQLTYLYFIVNCEKDLVKIGITNNIEKRLSALRGASGNDLYLHHVLTCDSREEALNLEDFLHSYFNHARKRPYGRKTPSEWFSLKMIGGFQMLSHLNYETVKNLYEEHLNSLHDSISNVNFMGGF